MTDRNMTTKAIVCRDPVDGQRRWELEEVEVPPLRSREILVEMVASGVCHTDLGCGSAPDGTPGFPVPPYPRVLGHEGAGYVRDIGSEVTKVKPGDAVLLSFAFCRNCHNCQHGAPGYCAEFSKLNFTGDADAFRSMSTNSKSIGGAFFGQSSFSQVSRVQETSVVNVTSIIKNKEELKLFAPLGCGIQTGAGTVTELARATSGDTVAVIGLGGVGLAAIMAAALTGCRSIIAIDRVASRLEMAKTLGATHLIDTNCISGSLPNEILKLTEATGTTITIDATGVVPLIEQGIKFTANQGKMILLGVAPMTATLQIPVVEYMVSGKKLLGSMEGGVLPEEYIPQMIQWYHAGKFPVDKLVRFFEVSAFGEAVEEMENGKTIKPILLW
ncbi:chaperonin 10-like protein [Aspergillus pseudoustus]|uniref:Chaperonin 10-like protein n=1 Tax=Aspergillus pseudoustus TaxID=1810923 RepID=A0ABR4KAR4_9EURO